MRPIDADALIEILAEMQGRCATKAALVQNSKIWQQVKAMPTVDAQPVRHGKWKWWGSEFGYKCSECKAYVDDLRAGEEYKYCPYCGAKMEEEE